MIISLILLFIGLASMLKGYSRGLLVVLTISLTNDLFKIPLSFSLSIHHTLALLYSPVIFRYFIKNAYNAKRVISPLLKEIIYLLFLALIFGFIFPWRSEYDYLRTWSQLAEGRAIIQVIRLFADLSLILLVYYLLLTERVSFDFLLQIFAVIISLTVLMAVINYLAGNRIKLFLFPEIARDIVSRFTGINNEPRSLGRVCSIGALFLLAFLKKSNQKVVIIGLILSLTGIVLSFSASAYIMTVSWILIFVIITRKSKVLIVAVSVGLLATFFITKNKVFQSETQRKLEKVLVPATSGAYTNSDKIDAIEPVIFTRFEVFDRAALNFLYRHPVFSVFGTGPNLISIPASPYLSKSSKAIYGTNIDSVPHSLLINILARSGLIGIFLWIIFIRRMLNYTGSEKKAFFLGLIIATMFVNNTLFYLFIGLLLYFSETDTDTVIS